MELILGEDYYGDWSTHFKNWQSRDSGELLIVKFEEVKYANYELLQRVRNFIGLEDESKVFKNPLEIQHQQNPRFFRSGRVSWSRPAHWTTKLESIFIALHGGLLSEMDYIAVSDYYSARNTLDSMELKLVELANKALAQRNSWLYEAELKERVVQQLAAATNRSNAPGNDDR